MTKTDETVVLVTKLGGMTVGGAAVKGFWFDRAQLIKDAERQVDDLRERGIPARLEVER